MVQLGVVVRAFACVPHEPEQVQQGDIDAGEFVTTVIVSSSDALVGEDTASITSIVNLPRINALAIGEIE